MTHDELVVKINLQIHFWSNGMPGNGEDNAYCQLNLSSWKALREVVELHAPEVIGDTEPPSNDIDKSTVLCGHCFIIDGEFAFYPCPTTQKIKNELG